MYDNIIRQYLTKHGFEALTPKAVLFDMDGVLYDSMPYHARSWHTSMAAFGLDMKPEEAYMYEGMRGVETIKLIARRQWNKELTDDEAAAMYKRKTEEFCACPKAKKMEGVEELMRMIKDGGKEIVVVTGSGQGSLLKRLEEDFSGLIDSRLVVTAADVSRGKPDPEPYIKGLAKAGIKPCEGIVVENAPLGVRAAVAAGIFTVAVNTGPLPDKALADEGADLIFPDMKEAKNFFKQTIF